MNVRHEITCKDGRTAVIRMPAQDEMREAAAAFASVASEKRYLNTETVPGNMHEEWAAIWKENGERILFIVPEVASRIVGGLVLTQYSGSPKTSHVRDLGMWIIREYRGIGIGSVLMEEAIRWARNSEEIHKLTLGGLQQQRFRNGSLPEIWFSIGRPPQEHGQD